MTLFVLKKNNNNKKLSIKITLFFSNGMHVRWRAVYLERFVTEHHLVTIQRIYLLVNPVLGMGLPVEDLTLLKPKGDLLLGIFNRVRSVADVATDLNAEITADSAWGRL